MDILEKDLEGMIFKAAQTVEGKRKLNQRGLPVRGKFYSQLNLGSYGIADLVSVFIFHNGIDPETKGRTIHIEIDIYELKKGEITISAVLQACRYKAGIFHHYRSIFDRDEVSYRINIILVGDSIDRKSDFAFLIREARMIRIFTYHFDIEGLFFNELGHSWDIAEIVKLPKQKLSFRDLILAFDTDYRKLSIDESSDLPF